MEAKHKDWKVLQLFTLAVVAAIVSSTLSNAALVQAAPISEPTIEERLAAVREYLKRRGEENTDQSHTVSSAQDNPEADSKDNQLSQWNDWPNWGNWNDWRDWRDWNNWPNWRNY